MRDEITYGGVGMERTGLKKCPWCGHPGMLVERQFGYGNSRGYTGCHAYFVQCSNENCRATGPHEEFDDIYQKQEIAVQKAIDQWNTRADNAWWSDVKNEEEKK